MRFYCHCLNVIIDVLETNDNQETLTQYVPVDLVQFVNVSHEWLLCNVPSDQAVRVAWHSLFQTIPVREMKLNRCLGCNLYTHVTNIAPSQMLINKDLLNEETVHSTYADPNYSKITKIVLTNTMNSPNMTRLSGSQDETIQRECEVAQQTYRQLLEDVERETEEKIRMYQREQEQLLETKKKVLNKELETFSSLMRSVSRHTSSAKVSPTSSSYINENSTESGFGSDIFDVGATDFTRTSATIERVFAERNANLDEETNDDPMLDNKGWYVDSGNSSNFATSVPKNITFHHPSSSYAIPQQHGDDDDSDFLERIGKSFRDLSRSMCTDGTELFGDLPSPRLNAHRT